MKAIVYTQYGTPDVLRMTEVEKPVPRANELLIKVCATSVVPGDCELRSFKFPPLFWLPLRIGFGIFSPRWSVLGQEFSGIVEAIGKEVIRFQVGDKIFGPSELNIGTYTQYICLAESGPICLKPDNLTHEEAATVPTGALNALHFVRKAKIKQGDQVLINGAGGNIGTYAVQLAKYFGAKVTAIDKRDRFELLHSLGAEQLIDYTTDQFSKRKNYLLQANNNAYYDVIFDIVGKTSFSKSMRSLTKRGRYVSAIPQLFWMLRGLWVSWISNKKVFSGLAPYKKEDLIYLKDLIEKGIIKTAVDKNYTLEEIPKAHEYLEKGFKIGNLSVTVH